MLESHQNLTATEEGLSDIYTAHDHIGVGERYWINMEQTAVGIIAGGITCDGGNPYLMANRKDHFLSQWILE